MSDVHAVRIKFKGLREGVSGGQCMYSQCCESGGMGGSQRGNRRDMPGCGVNNCLCIDTAEWFMLGRKRGVGRRRASRNWQASASQMKRMKLGKVVVYIWRWGARARSTVRLYYRHQLAGRCRQAGWLVGRQAGSQACADKVVQCDQALQAPAIHHG